MKSHLKDNLRHKLYVLLISVLAAVFITVVSCFAASALSTSIECLKSLCSKNIEAVGPIQVTDNIPGSVPAYGGSKITSISSSLNLDSHHFFLAYCPGFSTSLTGKKHTFTAFGYKHKFAPSGLYSEIKAGEEYNLYSVGSDGSLSYTLDKDIKTATDDTKISYHYNIYKCTGSLSSLVTANGGTGDMLSNDNMTSIKNSLGGCGKTIKVWELHSYAGTHLGHTSTLGHLYTDLEPVEPVDYTKEGISFIKCYTDSSHSSTTTAIYVGPEYVCNTINTCSKCGFEYEEPILGYWNATCISNNSETHHRKSVCSSCGKVYYDYTNEPHEFKNNKDYVKISALQHQHTETCTTDVKGTFNLNTENTKCGYTKTVFEDHRWKYSAYTSVDGTTHKCTRTCQDCKYSEDISEIHNLTYSEWTDNGDGNHFRTADCDKCGYSAREYELHSFNTVIEDYSDTQHKITSICKCGHARITYENHKDNNDDNICDACGKILGRFSVTIPASMQLVMAKDGTVYSADNACIKNNSTGDVHVYSVTVTGQNGWKIVPYDTNMANKKVDSKLIGFALLNKKTEKSGNEETFIPGNDWRIVQNGTMPLPYSAVASATSQPIENTQVLNVMFVIDWSDA